MCTHPIKGKENWLIGWLTSLNIPVLPFVNTNKKETMWSEKHQNITADPTSF